jgi:solute carrier family 45 protein 1/2/4
MGFTKDIGEALGNSNNSDFFNGSRNNWTEFFCIFFWIWLAITLAIMQITTSLLVADFAGERQVLGASISHGWNILGSLYVSRYISIVGYPLSSTHGYVAMASIAVLTAVVVTCVAANESPKMDVENIRTLSSKLKSIVSGIVAFPGPLCVYGLVAFVLDYGNLVYNWSLFSFFQMELFGAGDCIGVGCDLSQDDFMKASNALNDCSHWVFQVVAYLLTWAFPFAIERFGAKRVVAAAIAPQALLVIVAFVTKPVIVTQIVVVLITLSHTLVFVLVVPLIVHLMGSSESDIGVYLGVMYTTNSLASLLHYIVKKSAGYESSSLEYKLPIFIGGLTAVVGLAIWLSSSRSRCTPSKPRESFLPCARRVRSLRVLPD